MKMIECDERQRLLLIQELGKDFDLMEAHSMGEGFPIVFLVPNELFDSVTEALTKELRSVVISGEIRKSTGFTPLSHEDLES